MFGCIMDQMPHYILAHYYQVVNSGDLKFLQDQISSIDAAAGFLLHSMQMQEQGVPIVSCTNGLGKKLGGGRPSNWLDTVAFGHHDGLGAALGDAMPRGAEQRGSGAPEVAREREGACGPCLYSFQQQLKLHPALVHCVDAET